MLWNKISLEQPTIQLSGESRHLTPLWVSGNKEPLDESSQSDSSQSKTSSCFELQAESRYSYDREITYKIRAALKILAFREQHVLVQFWSPRAVGILIQGCNLHGYLALPVFDSNSGLCVGVLEILTSKYMCCAFEIQQVYKALKAENLISAKVFDYPTSKVLSERRQTELDKIYDILKVACDIHSLPLAQAWTVSPSSSYVAHNKDIEKTCSSFDTRCIGKACMSTAALPFHVRDLSMWHFRKACREQHLDKARGFVGKALLDRGSYYCEDVTELSEEEYPLIHYARMNGLTSCFTIFLHSVEGDDDKDYVLEFFLLLGNKDSRHVMNLVQTLKQRVEVASGFELGEISPVQVTEPPRDQGRT